MYRCASPADYPARATLLLAVAFPPRGSEVRLLLEGGAMVASCAETFTRSHVHVPGPLCCAYGLRVSAPCVPYVPKAQGSVPSGPHAWHVRRTRTRLGRAVRTMYHVPVPWAPQVTSRNALNFSLYDADAPTAARTLTPEYGPPSGGTAVTVRGDNFAPGFSLPLPYRVIIVTLPLQVRGDNFAPGAHCYFGDYGPAPDGGIKATFISVQQVHYIRSQPPVTCGHGHHYIRSQPPSHTVTASITYGHSLHYRRSQPPLHTVAARLPLACAASERARLGAAHGGGRRRRPPRRRRDLHVL